MKKFSSRLPAHHRAGCRLPQNNIIQRYGEGIGLYILQQHKNKLKVKRKQYIQRLKYPDFGLVQKRGKVQVIWADHNPSPFKSGQCEKSITQLTHLKISSKWLEALVKTIIKKLIIHYTNEQRTTSS